MDFLVRDGRFTDCFKMIYVCKYSQIFSRVCKVISALGWPEGSMFKSCRYEHTASAL